MMSEVGTEPAPTRLRDDEFYALHAAELVRFATALIGPSGADDLVADVCARVFAHPGWGNVTSQRAYMFRAVLNGARAHERARRRRERRELQVAVRDERNDDPLVRPEVIAAMRGLAARQRAIVFFTYWQDRTPSEIAGELGVTARTVQRELADAKRRLTEELR